MRKPVQRAIVLALTTLTGGALLGGCVYRREVVPAAAPTTVIVSPGASDRVVTYPEGRYELRGDGSAQNPWLWVWIPTGATPPNLPPLPRR
jgi:hypothetical protein